MIKRSQMEIIGLVIIMILISLGLLFFVQFSLIKGPSKTKKTFISKGIATSAMNAILETTTSCAKAESPEISITVTSLIKDCAEFYPEGSIDCGIESQGEISTADIDGTPDSCIYVRQMISELFGKTLDKWGRKYEFSSYLRDIQLIGIKAGGGCPPTEERESSTPYVTPTSAGNVINNIYIC